MLHFSSNPSSSEVVLSTAQQPPLGRNSCSDAHIARFRTQRNILGVLGRMAAPHLATRIRPLSSGCCQQLAGCRADTPDVMLADTGAVNQSSKL
jgi:hypothetical protein